MNKLRNAGIIGTGSCLPDKIVTNRDMEKIVDTTDEWINTRTGISERRMTDENTATSDLATVAARRALENAGLSPEEIDLILVATVTPDVMFPSTACIVQDNIGAINAAAFDLEAACSGFLYGLAVAENFIKTGYYRNIMVIGAEALTKIIDFTDRNTCVLFGDGAGAAIVSEVPEGYGILSTYIGADGKGGKLLTVPAGGSRIPSSVESVQNRLHYVKMDGKEVFKFAVKIMGDAAEKALEKCGLDKEDIDFLIPHQANRRIIDASVKRLKMPNEKVYINLDKYGNMSSASVAVAIDEASRKGLLKDGDTIVLVGFGGGLTWGSAVLKWKSIGRN
ncbi:MAG TPA: beta-ketoacyl-ACP synthase III [Bacillota bacterium]|jgi:3-oxoacyl-[acyl-carrier-protein] synthase-3|nr:beta-ketoacyl-ACP synthase III [Bacillota bacterium]HRS21167.1 beta-ketoacyl-ACP synthase III [Clostridia bacterium]HRU41565.1 beta-ketoacyl-ACP synthase III [Candidatus Diapherotrites archaeon]